MKNIQVRVDDDIKLKADKIFNELGTTSNEAIKIFLKMAINNNGFPFELQIKKSQDLLDWVEGQMLDVSEEDFMNADTNVGGKFYIDQEFDSGVVDEVIEVKGFLGDEMYEDKLLSQARIKIIDTDEVDAVDAADAESADLFLVAASIDQHTNLLDEKVKIAILDEFFVFSKNVTAVNRVKFFLR